MRRLERAGVQKICGPRLNPVESAEAWFKRAEESPDMLAPQRRLANEKPAGETVSYEQLLAAWRRGRVMP